MTQTPGQRTASTVLDLIDGAIGGDTSPDAMRWTPEPEPPKRKTITVARMHIGRAWAGTDIEDHCPCQQAPCGLVDTATVDAACRQHTRQAAKTLRQMHRAQDCLTAFVANPVTFVPDDPHSIADLIAEV